MQIGDKAKIVLRGLPPSVVLDFPRLNAVSLLFREVCGLPLGPIFLAGLLGLK